MNKLRIQIAVLLALFASFSVGNAQLIYYDGFNYAGGNLTASAPGVWTAHSSAGANPVQVLTTAADTGNSLSFPGFAASIGNRIAIGTGSAEDVGRDFTNVSGDGTDLYASFLIKVTAQPGANNVATSGNSQYIAHFQVTTAGSPPASTQFRGRLWIKSLNTGYQFGLYYQGWDTVVFDATERSLNTTYLVVMRHRFVAGVINDVADVWINPASGSFGAGSAPTPTLSVTNQGVSDGFNPTDDAPGITRFSLRQANGNGNSAIDEIRVGSTWASVTPAFVAPTDDPNFSSVSSVNFGNVAANTTTNSVLTVTNTGATQNLNITNATIGGANASHFQIVSGVPANNIAPAGTANITLRYLPNGLSGITTATLTITSNDTSSPTQVLSLAGIGISPLPLYEGFAYNLGNIVPVGRQNWNTFFSANQVPAAVVAGTLTYTGLTTTTGNKLQIRGGVNREAVKRIFADRVTSGDLYASFLLRVTGAPTSTTAATIVAFQKNRGASNFTQGLVAIKQGTAGNTFRLGVSNSLNSFANFNNTDLVPNTTYLVVYKYSQVAGVTTSNDTSKLFINPVAALVEGTGAETVTHTADASEFDLDESQSEAFNGVEILQQNSGNYTAEIDELRVARTYAEVLGLAIPNQSRNWNLFE